jgi:hypothetical protein
LSATLQQRSTRDNADLSKNIECMRCAGCILHVAHRDSVVFVHQQRQPWLHRTLRHDTAGRKDIGVRSHVRRKRQPKANPTWRTHAFPSPAHHGAEQRERGSLCGRKLLGHGCIGWTGRASGLLRRRRWDEMKMRRVGCCAVCDRLWDRVGGLDSGFRSGRARASRGFEGYTHLSVSNNNNVNVHQRFRSEFSPKRKFV